MCVWCGSTCTWGQGLHKQDLIKNRLLRGTAMAATEEEPRGGGGGGGDSRLESGGGTAC